MIIAIDGSAASGKGTLAKRLAAHFGLSHLDTGALYRAVALQLLNIGKSPIVLKDQLLKAGQSNLSPQFAEVFVTGRVNIPGGIKIPQGSTLNQAISLAGGTMLLKGKVEFIRFNREGTIDRRIFPYSPGAAADAPNNPILAAGDLIRVNDSILSGGVNVLNELTGPLVGLYSVYSLFNGIAQ